MYNIPVRERSLPVCVFLQYRSEVVTKARP